MSKSSFYCFGKSVRGREHRLSGLPNQDAFRIYIGKDNNPVIVALADGHGSPVHFRSEVGSKMAVDTAVDILSSVRETDIKVPTKICKYPTLITREWNSRVLLDHKNKKFSSDELSALYDEVKNESFVDYVRLDPKIGYGTMMCNFHVIRLNLYVRTEHPMISGLLLKKITEQILCLCLHRQMDIQTRLRVIKSSLRLELLI